MAGSQLKTTQLTANTNGWLTAPDTTQLTANITVKAVNKKRISIFTFHLFTTNRNIFKQVLHDIFCTKLNHSLSNDKCRSDYDTQ